MQSIMTIVWALFLCVLLTGQAVADKITVPVQSSASSRLLFPVVNKTIPVKSSVTLSSENGAVDAEIYSRLVWPGTEDSSYIRLLVIDLQSPPDFNKLTVSWSPATDPIRPFWGQIGNVTLVSPDREWLQQVIKLHPISVPDQAWYTDALRLHANYIADDERMKNDKYPQTRAAHWLYDKPQSFFQLFLLTGDNWALEQAKRLSSYYEMNVKEDGFFRLRNRNDVKYVMSRGLTYHFLLTGSEKMKDAVARQFEASQEWDPDYNSWTGFWTERNQAAALNTAIAHWELSGSKEAKERIDEIVKATYAMTFEPENDWPVRDCPQHTMEAHEGKGGDRPVCSPWMMALLADGLWRLVLLNDNRQATELLRAFGRFFAEYGMYQKQRKGKMVTAPYYLRAFPDHDWIEKNVWTDPQHNCEIAGMLGKSIKLYGGAQRAPKNMLTTFQQFATMCRGTLRGVAESISQQNMASTAIRLKPPRRFGWMYSSTAELPWMIDTILSDLE
ncbi:hypothetical protein [Alteromonas halophila]|uniref:Uncharacterized protein n=1 Tax=Alteromonas halophila TaxID=516698 RepID=A0A918JNU8_9ALTE|nr:hypothetical protein [Alteromonas halophila]GGW86900.1 hypothetical protein GCM10007391_20840 [Alteromonas halophila]